MQQKVMIAIAVFVFLPIIGYAAGQFYSRMVNRGVIEQLKSNPAYQRGDKVALFTLPSGRELPANYLMEDDRIYVGVDGFWWREFRGEGAPVEVLVRGRRYHGIGQVILDDPVYTATIFERLRPTVPDWLPDVLNGKLVVITVDSPDRHDE